VPEKYLYGIIIENNDFYITSNLYHDAKGNWNKNGAHSCAENAIDIKISSRKGHDAWKIIHNRFWGFRGTSKNGAPKPNQCIKLSDHGHPIISHYSPENNILFKNNIIFDSANGIGMLKNSGKYFSVIDNIFYNVANSTVTARLRAAVEFQAGSSEFYGNIFSKTDRYWLINSSKENNDLRNNVLIDVGNYSGSAPEGKNWTIGYNMFFDTGKIYASTGYIGGNFDRPKASDSGNGRFCFKRKLRTEPEIYCMDNILSTSKSPYVGITDQGAGKRKDIGVDNTGWKWSQSWLDGGVSNITKPSGIEIKHKN
jgi:hypothetical protein